MLFMVLIYSKMFIFKMAKMIDLEIKESREELQSIFRKNKRNLLHRQRIELLQYIQQDRYKYTYELAKKLKRGRKTIYNWIKEYRECGIDNYLQIKSRGSRKEVITEEMKKDIEEHLHNAHTDITGYVELLHLINNSYQTNIAYTTFYTHCRNHQNSKLKVARKSHYKKDSEAVELFKKPTL